MRLSGFAVTTGVALNGTIETRLELHRDYRPRPGHRRYARPSVPESGLGSGGRFSPLTFSSALSVVCTPLSA